MRKPLEGTKVLDFGHTVMGPCAGMILADLGAEVIKIEPAPHGDNTRYLKGFGQGYFGYFNRSKRSIALDLKTEAGLAIARELILGADVLIENFAPGTMDKLSLGQEAARALNPRLIYASLKGFMPGPYENRLALDEVVQMMAGLAYMTGPSGRPLRAGTSVVDIVGGMFAVIGILLALRQRDADTSNGGHYIQSALFESTVFLMGQHLCYAAQSATAIPPMPERVSAWAIYDLFTLADGNAFFLGITTDAHWQRFCEVLGRDDWAGAAELATNNQRIAARDMLLPKVRDLLAVMNLAEASRLCEAARVPFAPVNQPEDLFADEHLAATQGLRPLTLPNGIRTALPRLPLKIDGRDFDDVRDPPAVGTDTVALLEALGRNPAEVARLIESGAVFAAPTHQHDKKSVRG